MNQLTPWLHTTGEKNHCPSCCRPSCRLVCSLSHLQSDGPMALTRTSSGQTLLKRPEVGLETFTATLDRLQSGKTQQIRGLYLPLKDFTMDLQMLRKTPHKNQTYQDRACALSRTDRVTLQGHNMRPYEGQTRHSQERLA